MQPRPLPGTPLHLSVLCYGAGALGTAITGELVTQLLNQFRDAGGNAVDTAHVYGAWTPGGEQASERALGRYLRDNGPWDDLVLATKGGHPAQPWYPRGDEYLSREQLFADVQQSLAALGMDCIPLYWLHRDDTRREVGQIVEACNELVRAGLVRYLGASNWRAERIEAANEYARAHGLAGFVASQPLWNLMNNVQAQRAQAGKDTLFLDETELRWYRRTRFPILAARATACGDFASEDFGEPSKNNTVSVGRRRRARQLAEQWGVSATQIALAWLTAQPHPVWPIVCTSKPEHLQEAIEATEISLTPEQRDWLRDGDEEDENR